MGFTTERSSRFIGIEWVNVFSRRIYADIVLDSLKFCIENKQLKLFAWCIMSNHVHLIVQSTSGNLSATLGVGIKGLLSIEHLTAAYALRS